MREVAEHPEPLTPILLHILEQKINDFIAVLVCHSKDRLVTRMRESLGWRRQMCGFSIPLLGLLLESLFQRPRVGRDRSARRNGRNYSGPNKR